MSEIELFPGYVSKLVLGTIPHEDFIGAHDDLGAERLQRIDLFLRLLVGCLLYTSPSPRD